MRLSVRDLHAIRAVRYGTRATGSLAGAALSGRGRTNRALAGLRAAPDAINRDSAEDIRRAAERVLPPHVRKLLE